jgi:hypothetical protein
MLRVKAVLAALGAVALAAAVFAQENAGLTEEEVNPAINAAIHFRVKWTNGQSERAPELAWYPLDYLLAIRACKGAQKHTTLPKYWGPLGESLRLVGDQAFALRLSGCGTSCRLYLHIRK